MLGSVVPFTIDYRCIWCSGSWRAPRDYRWVCTSVGVALACFLLEQVPHNSYVVSVDFGINKKEYLATRKTYVCCARCISCYPIREHFILPTSIHIPRVVRHAKLYLQIPYQLPSNYTVVCLNLLNFPLLFIATLLFVRKDFICGCLSYSRQFPNFLWFTGVCLLNRHAGLCLLAWLWQVQRELFSGCLMSSKQVGCWQAACFALGEKYHLANLYCA